jgi:acid phosphatase (class A)
MKPPLPALLLYLALSLLGCQAQHPTNANTQPAAVAQPQATQADTSPRYLDPSALTRLESTLPNPPVDRGVISRGEGDLILALQGEASPAAKSRAKSEESFTVWAFADVLGPGFNRDSMPLTGALMRQAERDSAVVTRALKERWARKRPPIQDDRITPFLAVPKEDSYPSGHSVRAMLWARLLSTLAPAQEQDLLQRARLVAYDRVIGGVHYPTDVAAGLTLGAMVADEIAKSPSFQTELAKARAEWPPRSQ